MDSQLVKENIDIVLFADDEVIIAQDCNDTYHIHDKGVNGGNK